MKLITTLILLSTVALAQWGPGGIPTDWRGYGLEWMEATKFTSPLATSYLTMTTDTLTFALTGASADRDIYFNMEEEDGTPHIVRWDDGGSRWDLGNADFQTHNGNTFFLSYRVRLATMFTFDVGSKTLYTSSDFVVDPNNSGSGTLQLGETGDNDITLFQSQQRVDICTVDSTHTMGVDGTSFYTVTSASDSLLCPSTPVDGDVFYCKFTDAGGGTIDGNGNNLDGSASVATSENDNVFIVYNTDTSEWEIR